MELFTLHTLKVDHRTGLQGFILIPKIGYEIDQKKKIPSSNFRGKYK